MSQCRSYKHASEWLCDWQTVFVQDLYACVCEVVYSLCLVTLHALWSLLGVLPLMLFPWVCKLPPLWTILSCLAFATKFLNRYMSVCVSSYLTCLIYLSWSHSLSSIVSCNCLLSSGNCFRGGKKRKTMKLSRDLSNLVVFTNSVASQECLNQGETPKLCHLHTQTNKDIAIFFVKTFSHP